MSINSLIDFYERIHSHSYLLHNLGIFPTFVRKVQCKVKGRKTGQTRFRVNRIYDMKLSVNIIIIAKFIVVETFTAGLFF
jgi:hypothetical protein